jgi:hypothetical protein
MNVDELEAGSELDALVAERVMGWRRTSDSSRDVVWWIWILPNGVEIAYDDLPPFSTRVDMAWCAVDQIRNKQLADKFYIAWRQDGFIDGEWDARFGYFDTDYTEWPQGFADTPALAICRAALKCLTALKAVEGKDEEKSLHSN